MPTPLYALEVAELGPNCVIDSADIQKHIESLTNAKSYLLRQLTVLSKHYKIPESDRIKCYDIFRENFDSLIDDIKLDFETNQHLYLKQMNFGAYHLASIHKFKSAGNSLILCDKSYGIEFLRTHKLNEIKFQLLNSSEYIQLHQSQIKVSKQLHWNVYNFHINFMKDHPLWNIKSSPGYWPFHKNLLKCLNQVMATGWIFSPLVANVALLRIEYNNHKSYIVLMFGRYFNHTKLLYINLKLEVRYIDDIYEVWLINKSFFSLEEIQFIKKILRDDNGIRYKADDVNSLINLKSSVEYVEIFLDLEIRFDYLCRRFITDIHRKPGKLNTLLVHTSNNSPDHFFGVFQSGLFRSICLIDNRVKQKLFMHKFKCGLRERNWSLHRIKQCVKRSKLSYNKRH
eukprot:526677_1